MALSDEEIVNLYHQRRQARSPLIQRMHDTLNHYEGSVYIPLPELDADEKPYVANLLQQGLDQLAMRVSSVMPTVEYPEGRPGIKKSQDQARRCRNANLGWWTANRLGLQMASRSRWHLGYGVAPTYMCWDRKLGSPRWMLRNPLGTYPAHTLGAGDIEPDDCIFTYHRSLGWLQGNYPGQTTALYKGKDVDDPDSQFTLLEYHDAEQTVLLAMGSEHRYEPGPYEQVRHDVGTFPFVRLETIPNRIGVCPVVYAGRVSLRENSIVGMFDQMQGMFQMQAKLMALEVIAVERGIFPDQYLVSHPGESADIIVPADGRIGQVGEIKGGTIMPIAVQPGYQTGPMIDRLERAQRLSAGIPAEFGGESGSNIRTARRGDAVLSAAVDFPIGETQDLFAASLEAENRRAILLAKSYLGGKKVSFDVNWKGAKGSYTYTPSEDFQTTTNWVKYSMPGTDVNGLVIGLGQRIGTGLMSKKTARAIDPLIEDDVLEGDYVVGEALDQALLASVQQQAEQGAISPSDLARIRILVRSNSMELAEAVQKVHEEVQARQAAVAPLGAPEAQPGLGPPGAQQPQAIPPGPPSMQNLSMLLNSLRRPSQQSPSETAAFGASQ